MTTKTKVNDIDNSYEALFNKKEDQANEPEPATQEIKPKKEKQKPKEKAAAPSYEIRVTLQMPASLHKKIKIMAHWELTSLKDIINASLEKAVEQYEKTHGQLLNVPKSQNIK